MTRHILLAVFVLLIAGPAFAQEVVPQGQNWVAVALGGVVTTLGVVVMALRFIAPLTKSKTDDLVLAQLTEVLPFVQALKDPQNPQGVPTPANPSGVEG